MYDIDYFIKKFEAIPEIFWNDCAQTDVKDGVITHCAFGHLQSNPHIEDGDCTREGRALSQIFYAVGWNVDSGKWITHINNGRCAAYQQPTPKQRMLAALKDIKQMAPCAQ